MHRRACAGRASRLARCDNSGLAAGRFVIGVRLWRVCVCPRCGYHVGWMFEPEDLVDPLQPKPSAHGFYGIVLDKGIDENFSDSVTLAHRPLQ